MKKLFLTLLALILLVRVEASTGKKITGLITDGKNPIPGAFILANKSKAKTTSDKNGTFNLEVGATDTELLVSYLGYKTQKVKLAAKNHYKILLIEDTQALQEVQVVGYASPKKAMITASSVAQLSEPYLSGKASGIAIRGYNSNNPTPSIPYANDESYAKTQENFFHKTTKDPLSTFSIDVDAAAYSNVRRFINNGNLPPADAVRIEEMINYFDYHYEQPVGNDPVKIQTEVAKAPWNLQHQLVHIGLQAKTIKQEKLPSANLVFLIDVSGSMDEPNKLPLLVSSLKLLTDQLREKDKVAIVVYAGSSGLVLPATSGSNKIKIKEALTNLQAGGSTAGGAGINLAYKIAAQNYIKGGNNRIILATDGDFNVGANSDAEMENLITEKRKSGIFLSVLGFGMGNYKDSKMEVLADKGNGNYAYIDNLTEARKVLVKQFGGTLFTLAKDVKLQIEFNPAKVQAYRLIGYENRLLNDEDFNDDKKDAGEIGSGHTVTALYEIIPVGINDSFTGKVDELKYQKPRTLTQNRSEELLTVKLRYKTPTGDKSKLMSQTVEEKNQDYTSASQNFRFAAAVAEFGMILKASPFKQNANFDQVIQLAENAKGNDKEGYRTEFLGLVKSAKLLSKEVLSTKNKRIMNEEN